MKTKRCANSLNSQFPGVRSAISGHRYYSPTLGRFINKDPIEEQGGLNLYAFCSNNGVNSWDLLGNDDPWDNWIASRGEWVSNGNVYYRDANGNAQLDYGTTFNGIHHQISYESVGGFGNFGMLVGYDAANKQADDRAAKSAAAMAVVYGVMASNVSTINGLAGAALDRIAAAADARAQAVLNAQATQAYVSANAYSQGLYDNTVRAGIAASPSPNSATPNSSPTWMMAGDFARTLTGTPGAVADLAVDHWTRNAYNNVPLDLSVVKTTWTKMSDFASQYHRIGQGNESNTKYISPDGHSEVVIRPNGDIVTDKVNLGTYNFVPPREPVWNPLNLPENAGHGVLDVLPYYFFGNTPDDHRGWLNPPPPPPPPPDH